jgi:hypothetical protein
MAEAVSVYRCVFNKRGLNSEGGLDSPGKEKRRAQARNGNCFSGVPGVAFEHAVEL